jgi:hypothetical protein
VHVRRTLRDIPQGRRLESELGFNVVRLEFASSDVLGCGADIVELVIGEVPSVMTARALRSTIEQDKSPLRALGDCALIAVDPGIKRCVARDDSPLVVAIALTIVSGLTPAPGKTFSNQAL